MSRFVTILLLLLTLGLLPAAARAQTTFTVNNLGDEVDASPGDGVCDVDPGASGAQCSLRAAIEEANALPGADTIAFAVTGRIHIGFGKSFPDIDLPDLIERVVIDGTTAPGYAGSPLVELDGPPYGNPGIHHEALTIIADSVEVQGLSIINFEGDGITIEGDGATVVGCYIGIAADSTSDGVKVSGIRIHGNGNIIGVPGADQNVISSNGYGSGGSGLQIEGAGNRVQNNLIGTDPTGTVAYSNARAGIRLYSGASGNLIGGTAAGARNVISGQTYYGVLIDSAHDNFIYGNYIGTNAAGDAALGNGVGVFLQDGASGNFIGSREVGVGNVISGNYESVFVDDEWAGTGILIEGAGTTGNVVEGNIIGLDAGGQFRLGGQRFGVLIREGASGNVIGGPDPSYANVISGHIGDALAAGVTVSDTSNANQIQNNHIGLDGLGEGADRNANGVVVDSASGTLIEGNVIAGSGFYAIRLVGALDTKVLSNLIGTDATGNVPLGNNAGIYSVGSGGSLIAQNTIAYSHGLNESPAGGLLLAGSGTSNHVTKNSLYANEGLGIDLIPTNGVSTNDPGDADTGPNNLQNFPEIQKVGYEGATQRVIVTYFIDTAPANAAYPLTVEFFQADAEQQEGKVYLGGDTYEATDYNGCSAAPCVKTISFIAPVPLTSADVLLATATDADGNTSEFTAMGQPLPVELAAFEVTVEGRDVVLMWKTLSEKGSARFEIQRAEVNITGVGAAPRGRPQWQIIGHVDAAGTTTEAQSYRYTDEGVPFEAEQLVYRLRQIDLDGTATLGPEVEVALGLPGAFALHGNFPNPFTGATTIRYELPEAAKVRLAVYDLLGREVTVLVDEEQAAGRKEVSFDASGLSSGAYFVRLQAAGFTQVRRMMVVR